MPNTVLENPSDCAICGNHIGEELYDYNLGTALYQRCPRCGEFKIIGDRGDPWIKIWRDSGFRNDRNHPLKINLAGWVRDQNRADVIPAEINCKLVETLKTRQRPSIPERAERLLLDLAQVKVTSGTPYLTLNDHHVYSTYSKNIEEVQVLAKFLEKIGYIEHHEGIGWCYYEILPHGYIKIEESTRKPVNSDKVFVAMSFHENLNEVYDNGIQPAILDTGYHPIRMDQKEHINKIDDEIILTIKKSKFIVADFTEHRSGVYFEAGYAMGIERPIIWTCRKDNKGDLHFDIRQYNCIFWETPEELKERLMLRIEETVGKGSNVSETT